MTAEETKRQLGRVRLFHELDDEDLAELARGCREQSVSAGTIVVEQGMAGDEMHIILEGEFQVFVSQKSLAFEKEIGALHPGDYFGEIALITGKLRSASVRAVSPGRLLSLGRERFLELMKASADFPIKLCHALAGYVRDDARARAAMPFIRLGKYKPDEATLELIPAEVSKLCNAVAIERDGQRVTVAMVKPEDTQKRSFLEKVLAPLSVEFSVTTSDDMARFVDRVASTYGYRAKPPAAIELDFQGADGQAVKISENEAARIVRESFREAVALGASDVHFEPKRDGMQIRARIDGKLLKLDENNDPKLTRQVISMIKVLGNLDIAEKRLPQDGNFAIKADEVEIDARLSIMPNQNGEKAVTRLLDPRAQLHFLNQIILSGPVSELATELFTRAAGLTLVTGPTGSGKTTTLYAGLRSIWEENNLVNIVSAEDPIDQRLGFATQTQINPSFGLTFPKVLRGVLRQDPDVILIGEIRDDTSAAIALEAAITGHTVLSSLHTKHAVEAVTRLRNLHCEPYLIAAALNGVISQRLLPRLNPRALLDVPPDDPEIDRLRRINVLDEPTDELKRGAEANPDNPAEIGRVALCELLAVDDAVRNAIELTATSQELEESLHAHNFVSMKRYARFLLQEHQVSPGAVLAVFPEVPGGSPD